MRMALSSGVSSLGVLDLLIDKGDYDSPSSAMASLDWVGCGESLPAFGSPDLLGESNLSVDDILDNLSRGLDDLEREQNAGPSCAGVAPLYPPSGDPGLGYSVMYAGAMDETHLFVSPPEAACEVEVANYSQEHSYSTNTNCYQSRASPQSTNSSFGASSNGQLVYHDLDAPSISFGMGDIGFRGESSGCGGQMWGSVSGGAVSPSLDCDSGLSATCSSPGSSNAGDRTSWPSAPSQSSSLSTGSVSGQFLVGGMTSDLDQYLSSVSYVIDPPLHLIPPNHMQQSNNNNVSFNTANPSMAVMMENTAVYNSTSCDNGIYPGHKMSGDGQHSHPIDRGRTGTRSLLEKVSKTGNSSCNTPLLPFHSKDVATLEKYPALNLNEEEISICEREDIHLPTHYPLTRMEERDLKKVRRKIRNKISAEESRRKKKVYMEGLEVRVNKVTTENRGLKKEVDSLKKENSTLMSELKRLQALVGGKHKKTAQTGTCLAVMLLSFALLVAPNYSPLGRERLGKKAAQQALKRDMTTGHSRTLLSVPENPPVANDAAGEELVGSSMETAEMDGEATDGMLLTRDQLNAASMKIPTSVTKIDENQPISDEYANELKISQVPDATKRRLSADTRYGENGDDWGTNAAEKILVDAMRNGFGLGEKLGTGSMEWEVKMEAPDGNSSDNGAYLLGKRRADEQNLLRNTNETSDDKLSPESAHKFVGQFKRLRHDDNLDNIGSQKIDLMPPIKVDKEDLARGVAASVTIPAVYVVKSEEL